MIEDHTEFSRGDLHAEGRRGGAQARPRALALPPVLDALEPRPRRDAEHRTGLRGAVADRDAPSVPLPPQNNVRSSVLERLATLPRFKTRLLWRRY